MSTEHLKFARGVCQHALQEAITKGSYKALHGLTQNAAMRLYWHECVAPEGRHMDDAVWRALYPAADQELRRLHANYNTSIVESLATRAVQADRLSITQMKRLADDLQGACDAYKEGDRTFTVNELDRMFTMLSEAVERKTKRRSEPSSTALRKSLQALGEEVRKVPGSKTSLLWD